ncbi:transcriptional regulator, LysR family [Desulfurobacterium thermolithotrophum DSM 11699]|uniref:Transcriptional regulator, LysR family n=1 Tax=Desulfurobacterium thermolithotrophum (strain DSM 11699 / BSA) TaxID=868864 RepID=F0S2T0_DESTD|nr:LysR family transcriptional regulator [Desulfurobacterium thermolithotrophum]ADY73152.1 transcriptional regulator, LysR family [Desulfurobacterium thermolithotrophum DSM 11699]
MVDYNTLKAFKLVVDLKSFSAAAKVLNVSQPAITNRIKSLERFLGAPLFVRKGKSFTLSSYGEILYREIDIAIESLDRIKNLMIKLSKNTREKLRFAASTTVGNWFIPGIIQSFIQNKDISIEMLIGNTEEVVQNILSRYFDFGIVEGKAEDEALSIIPIKEDKLVLIKAKESPIPDVLSIEDLLKYPIVVRERGSGTRNLIEEILSKFNITFSNMKIFAEIGNTTSIINFVSKNPNVIAFVPEVAVKDDSTVQIIKTKDIQITRKFSLLIHKDCSLNMLAREFIGYLLNFQQPIQQS